MWHELEREKEMEIKEPWWVWRKGGEGMGMSMLSVCVWKGHKENHYSGQLVHADFEK